MELADLRFRERPGAVVGVLAGEIDMSNVDELRAALEQRAANDDRSLLVDLSGVQYIDSAGIHMLYRVRARLRDRGHPLALVVPPGSVAEDALRYAAVLDELDVSPSVDEAVAWLRDGHRP